MRETSLGLVPDLAGTAPLVEAVGYARALEICATGRWVAAAEAAAIGLATAVVPAADLDATVDDLVAALLAAPAGSLRETLLLLRGPRAYAGGAAGRRASGPGTPAAGASPVAPSVLSGAGVAAAGMAARCQRR